MKRAYLHKLLQVASVRLLVHDLEHFLSDGTDLGSLGIGCLLDLVLSALCEADSEEADEVSVGGSDIEVGLDECLPLSDERAKLVGGEVHSEE